MGVRVEIQNTKQVAAALTATDKAVAEAVEEVQKDYRKEVKNTMEKTSPVKTGLYKSNWGTDKKGQVYFVTNDTEYAPYLVWPNQRMVGSPKAEKPGAGILHNVRGRIKKMKKKYEKSMIKKVNTIIETASD